MTHTKLNKSFGEINLEQKQGVIRFIEDFKNDPAIKYMKVNGNVAFAIQEGEYVGRKALRDYLIENELEDREAVYNHLVRKLSEEIKYYKSEDPQIPEISAKIGDIHSASLKEISDIVEQYTGGLTPRYRSLMNHFKALKSENLNEGLFKGHSSPYADELSRLEPLIGEEFADQPMLEEYLYENSYRIVKIFLNVSKEEQAKRFLSRIEEPEKNWKFSGGDYEERKYWDGYMEAFEDCINETATKDCPWYVVPADHKWYMRYVVSEIILAELEDMDPKYPEVTKERLAQFEGYREALTKELEKKESK